MRNWLRLLATLQLATGILLVARMSPATDVFVAPDGNDAAPGTAAEPWRTIQVAIDRTGPGDTIFVRPGIYRESLQLVTGGLADAPRRLIASPGAILESPDSTQSLSAFDLRAGVGFVSIEGFEIAGGYHESIFLRPGTHDIVLDNLYIHDNRVGMWIAGSQRVEVSRTTVAANRAHGIRVYQGSRDIVFRDTTAIANDDGLACEGDADGFIAEADVVGFRCTRCQAIANGEDGFDLAARDVLLEQTWARDNHCGGIKLYRGGTVQNSISARNRTGVLSTNLGPEAAMLTLDHVTVADNSGVQVLLRAPTSTAASAAYTAVVQNSILAGAGKLVEIELGVRLADQYNLFYRPDSTGPAVVVHGRSGMTSFTGQEINAGVYQSRTGRGLGTLAVDPAFADESTYTLESTSAAIDRAAPRSGGGADISGHPRAIGLRPDIGAQETAFSLANHPPWPDPGPPRTVIAGKRFWVSAFGSVDPDGDPIAFTWNFADGSAPATTFTARHVYYEPGTYNVTLEATDGMATRTRSTPVTVTLPPTSHLYHDTAILPLAPQRVVIARGRTEALRRLRITVQNADVDPSAEPLGHLIEVHAADGTCPAGTVVTPPDFDASTPGSQNRALVPAGRNRTARLVLRFPRMAAPGCEIRLQASTILPGNVDPQPANDVATVVFSVIDRNNP